jgi:hydroxymethylpyrimidine/phosphomethylpyrimidine kinase
MVRGSADARVILVGGVDPRGGAGVLRDLLTAVELGAEPTVTPTAFTEQDATSVASIEPRDSERVARSVSAALARAREPGVKVGMVATGSTARAIASVLDTFAGPVVFDPVLRASSGGSLYCGGRDEVLELAARSTLLTPNLSEAAWLLDRVVETLDDAKMAARDLVAMGVPAVLVKGGHLRGAACDVLLDGAREHVFTSVRVTGASPRGTGCALATAIAVGLVRGQDLKSAVASAKAWLTAKIAGAHHVDDEWHL